LEGERGMEVKVGCNETASEGLRKCRRVFHELLPKKKRRPRIPGAALV